MSPENYERIIQACWQLANGGLGALEAEKIAREVQLSPQDIRSLFPEKKHVIFALLADLKKRVVLPEQSTSEAEEGAQLSSDDLFFDGVFTYFDEAAAHKNAIKKLANEVMWDPFLMIAITPTFQEFANYLIQYYYPAPRTATSLLDTGHQFMKRVGYQFLLLRVFYVWLEDDSFDSGKTMAALDQGIKQNREYCSYFGG